MSNTLQQRLKRHQLLRELRIKLLRLHKILLDTERIRYEQGQGRVSSGELLQLAISHEHFAWLHRLSEMILKIDAMLQADEPLLPEAIAAFITNVRTLLTPNEFGDDFAMKYDAAFQRSPDVVLAHADVLALLATGVQR